MARSRLLLILAIVAIPITALGAQGQPPAPSLRSKLPNLVDRCQPRDGEEIVVCGSRDEQARYRLPQLERDGFDPEGPIDSVSRARHRLYEVGDSGIASCSTVGPGGYEGCGWRRFKQEVEQRGK